MTTTEPVPLRRIKPGEVYHPGWCSPDRCRADQVGKTHESAPVQVGELTVSVSQSMMDRPTHAVLTIDADPTDDESFMVMLRLGEVPELARALLDLYVRQ